MVAMCDFPDYNENVEASRTRKVEMQPVAMDEWSTKVDENQGGAGSFACAFPARSKGRLNAGLKRLSALRDPTFAGNKPVRRIQSRNILLCGAGGFVLSMCQRPQFDARVPQRPGHSFRNLRCAGRVPMDADRLRRNRHAGSVRRRYRTFLHDPKRLLRRLFRIANQRIFMTARTQRAIRFVPPIRKGLGSYTKPRGPKSVEHRRTRQAHQHQVLAESSHSIRNRASQRRIVNSLVV